MLVSQRGTTNMTSISRTRFSLPTRSQAGRIDELVGTKKFVRHNPMSDHFPVHRFHHIEFWCPDATSAYKRFQTGLGMQLVAKSDQATGNTQYGSYVLQSDELVFAFTAPYSRVTAASNMPGPCPHPNYKIDEAYRFVNSHGLGVRAVGVVVDDASDAFRQSVSRGAMPATSPVEVHDPESGKTQVFSEVVLYGDVVLRYISGDFDGPYLAQYAPVESPYISYGLHRLDHAVGNVDNMGETASYIKGFTGFHEFAEFTHEEVGTMDSGLNSVVLANNNEYVLLPVNEPTFGTRRKSQIQTFLEQNEGPGLQHLALMTPDIFGCLRKMAAVSELGGFEFMPRPSNEYYRQMPGRIGDSLTPDQYALVEELGVLVDKDDQGILLQIFTKPISDRATIFLEIIQRIGCEVEHTDGDGRRTSRQKGGCGGFGKFNFSELFKSIENYERTLSI